MAKEETLIAAKIQEKQTSLWRVAARLIQDMVIAAVVFLFVAAIAVGINLVVSFLQNHQIDGTIITGLQIVEYSIFVLDVVLFFRLLYWGARRFWRDLS